MSQKVHTLARQCSREWGLFKCVQDTLGLLVLPWLEAAQPHQKPWRFQCQAFLLPDLRNNKPEETSNLYQSLSLCYYITNVLNIYDLFRVGDERKWERERESPSCWVTPQVPTMAMARTGPDCSRNQEHHLSHPREYQLSKYLGLLPLLFLGHHQRSRSEVKQLKDKLAPK